MGLSVNTVGGDLTWHVHHPAAAHPEDLVGLTEQTTGANAVCVITWELLFAGGAAVPPGLGQVGQLSTQRFIRPQSEPTGGTFAGRTVICRVRGGWR